MNNSPRCQTLDLLAVEARSHTPPSLLTLITPCTPPEPGGVPQMARNFDPDMMAQRGILSALQHDDGHFLASPYGQAFAIGNIGLEGTGSPRGTEASRQGVPRVRQAKAQVKGNLDRDIIRRIVRAHINEVRHCYANGLSRRPRMRGRLAIRFTIGSSGKVSASTVSRSSLGDTRVEHCISAAVRRWKFPKPQDGDDVVVTYPFVLDQG